MKDFLQKNKLLAFIALILLTFLLLWLDPFFLDRIAHGSPITALYLIIPIVLWLFFVREKPYSKSELTPEEKEYINKEKIKSFIRSGLQVFGAFIAVVTLLGLKIPYIEPLHNALKYLSEKADIAIGAINAIIGIVIYLIGFFKDADRFESRSIVNPRRINL